MSDNPLKPPVYCPSAIATDAGWVNPKSGELLVSVRDLKRRIQEAELADKYKTENQQDIIEPKIELIVQDDVKDIVSEVAPEDENSVTLERVGNVLTLEIKEDLSVEESFNKPKQRGRPKKQQTKEKK